MEWLNYLDKKKNVSRKEYEVMMVLLASFAPHMTEELWQGLLKHTDSVHIQAWPTFDEKNLVQHSFTLAVQVNGKVRDTLEVGSDKKDSQAEVEALARQSVKIQSHLEGKEVRKVIYVPGKIVNFVVS